MMQVGYSATGHRFKPVVIRAARVSESTISKYGEYFKFQTAEGGRANQLCLLHIRDQIKRYHLNDYINFI